MRADISVIIPTIGRQKALHNCLNSLSRQSILPDEIVIVDNSADSKCLPGRSNSSYLLSGTKINIKYIREARRGVAYARNAGIKAAKNDLIAFIDDDCIADKDWIEKIMDSAKKYTGVLIQGMNYNGLPNNIFSCIEHFTTQSFFFSGLFKDSQGIYYSKFLDTKNCLIKKSLVPRFSYFDKQFFMLEDVDFSLTMARKGIKTILNKDIRVLHFGRSNLFSHILREFNKGRNYYRLKKKWQISPSGYKEIENMILKIHEDKVRRTEKKLTREILAGKSYLFSLLFYLFRYIDPLVIQTGCEFEKFRSDNNFTRIFLPLRIRVRKI